jgi:nucleoside-diphosphate-sugar epimerase
MSKSKQPTIIITGAGGFLGSHLVAHFADQGWQVLGLVRQPKKALKKRPNIRYITYDLAKPFDETIFKGVDYLVHAVKHDTMLPDAMQVNIEGAQRLLAASRKYKLKKNVFISTMSAHDDAISRYGKQKLAVEQLFNTKHDVILRAGLIVGNGGIVQQMADFMRRRHAVPLIGGGTQPLQIIAVYDLAHLIERVLAPDATGTFVAATPKVYTYKVFYQAIAVERGIKVLYVPVPFGLLLGAFRLAQRLNLSLSMNEDNLLGLKMLRSMDSAPGLERLGVHLDSLQTALHKAGLQNPGKS